MYSITAQSGNVSSYVMEFQVDKLEDIATLPTTWKTGSSCIVIEDSSVFMLNNNKEWVELK